ncbi:hypothetical protein HPP92_008668 [Vanilla planifolia]|uniref:Zinc-finger domain-containing protein n=1 Tax=Vanilla planifolia TaxID=51239 RepID=A0A835REJ8_VANPL|nr:hypothetical protein HPP92_008866 [Vanilla planifolia]KAG0486573.1 hypothetical protein HPP92_008668 [Vanilla planifolia]
MAVPPTSPASDRCKVEEDKTKKEREPSQNKRSKNPGVRVQGGRIYDPELGKTCHQCRQKTMDFAASCKVVEGNKPCTIQFCHKCLLNRYGENAEEVSNLDDWRCPKCRGVCNCSFCMRKKGHKPTGILVHTAKHTGFSSVHEMLSNGGLKTENVPKDASSSPNNVPVHKKGPVSSKRGRDKGNCNFVQDGLSQIEIDGFKKSVLAKRHEKPLKKLKLSSHAGIESNHNNVSQVKGKLGTPAKVVLAEAENNKENLNGNTKDKNIVKVPKFRRLPPKLDYEPIKEEIIRSPGKPLTVVAGVELPHEDVGPALQFWSSAMFFQRFLI